MKRSKIETLLKTCVSGDAKQQIASIEELVELQADSAIPVLLELLSSSEPVVRLTSVQAVTQLASNKPELVGAKLMILLTDSDEIVRSEVIYSMEILNYKPAFELVKSLLKQDPSAIVRASAAEALGDWDDNSALSDLELAFNDSDESVRAYTANSFGLLAESPAILKLDGYLQSEPSVHVKAEILGAQYRLGSSKAFASLLDLISVANDDLGTPLLNLLEDLIGRKTPASLPKDTAILCQALSELAQRLPMQRTHTEKVIAKLQAISVLK